MSDMQKHIFNTEFDLKLTSFPASHEIKSFERLSKKFDLIS